MDDTVHFIPKRAWGSAATKTVNRLLQLVGRDATIILLQSMPGERIPAARHIPRIVKKEPAR